MLITRETINDILDDFQQNLLEQNQMGIEYRLYHLYVHSIFLSNIESFLKMHKYIYRCYIEYFVRLDK